MITDYSFYTYTHFYSFPYLFVDASVMLEMSIPVFDTSIVPSFFDFLAFHGFLYPFKNVWCFLNNG